jgi:zinc protease
MSMSKRTVWLGLALLVVLGDVALAQNVAPSSEGQFADPKIPFKKYTLDNGLEVILHQDKSVPLVTVNLWYHVGSGDEVVGKSGFAHLFEHMMFQGTKNTGEDKHFEILREIGSDDVNGSTNPNRTNYYETVPSNQLEVALWLESERMGYLLDGLTQKSLDNQREVVRNERRQSYDNVPYGKERFVVSALLYPEGHPYRYLTIGLHEDLVRASVDDVKAFFRKWYRPSNATLCLAGDIDLDEAQKLVAKWFGTFPRLEKPQRRIVEPPTVDGPKRQVVEDPFAKLRRVHYAWHSPALYAPGDAELDILASALGQSGTGRLYKTLVLDKQLARSVQVYQASTQMSSTFNVVADLRDNADLAEVEKLIDEELTRVLGSPVTEKELHRAVVQYEVSSVFGLEALLARAETLQAYNHFVGNPDWITQDLDRYRKSDVKAVQATAERYLQKKTRVEVITMPGKPKAEAEPTPGTSAATAPASPVAPEVAAAQFPQEEFRTKRPAAGPARPLVPPSITHFPLPNGVEVYLVERHELPTVSADLTFEGGGMNEPAGKEGLADVCTNVLDDGTEKLDKVAFEEALADIGSDVSAYAGLDQQGLKLRTLSKSLDATLDLWAASLRTPGLRQADLERDVKQALASIQQAKGAPGSVAQRVFGTVFYGPAHPFGHLATEASLGAIAIGDCKTYVADSFQPAGAKLYVVGDVTREQVEKTFAARLGSWQGQPKSGVAIGSPQPRAGRIFFVDVPGAAQSQIYLVEAGPKRQDADYVPTRLMMSILGGDFSSRINMNLREDKGWAYGAGGGIRYYRGFGSFRVGASVRTDATKGSVLELFKEVQKMSTGDVTDEELAREKSAEVLGLPGQFATGADVLASFRSLVYFGLPLDYWSHYTDAVSATQKGAVADAAKAHLKPADLQVLVVGDGKSVLPGLREVLESKTLGEGALVMLDADGKAASAASGN